MFEALLNLDSNILIWIQEFVRNSILNPIFIGITHLGDGGVIWIGISLLLLIPKKTRKIGIMGIVAIVLSGVINNICLKNIVARMRPFDKMDNLITLITPPVDYSFPSGHTAASFAVGWLLFRKLPKEYGIPSLILAILIGFSRLYVGVHYPSDVIMGMLSGIFISYIAEYLVCIMGRKRSEVYDC